MDENQSFKCPFKCWSVINCQYF